MNSVRVAFARLVGFFRGARSEGELQEELQAHLEMEIAEHVRRGLSPAEARRRALLASGGLLQAAEAVRDQRTLPWLESLAADLRHAVRALRLSPAFSALVIVTLALGIGANTAIFSVVRGVLLKPLPHREGERLVYVRHSADGPGGSSLGFSVPEIRDLRQGAPSLQGIAEYSLWSLVLHDADGAVRINVGLVTGNYFDVMGLAPALGRLTDPSHDGPGVPAVMVLTHELWLRRYGGDSAIIGRQLRLDESTATVIGVLQPAPFYPGQVEALLNMVVSDHHLSATMVEGRSHRMTEVVARLAPGATLERARAEVDAVFARMQARFPEAYDPAAHQRVTVLPFHEVLGERARLTLWLLMGAAAFVLIITVANVANLTLMRGVRRAHEFVVRAALGSGVGRLRRLLLVENLVLTLLGAAFGLAIAVGGLALLVPFVERYSPRAGEIRLDAPVLAFMISQALVVAFLLSLFGTLPRKDDDAATMLSGSHRTTGNVRRQTMQRALVVVQVAVSVVLLAGAGLLTRTMILLAEVETGLRTEEVLSMHVSLLTPLQLLTDPAAAEVAKQRYEEMRRQMAVLPGVIEAGVGAPGPLRGSQAHFEVKAEGRIPRAGEPLPTADFRLAGPEYFRAAGIPLLRGRHFADTDRPGAARIVIINQVLADRLFPGADPIGKRIAWTGEVLQFTPISGEWRTVVGIAGNTRDDGLAAAPRAAVFMPFAQEPPVGGGFVLRADSNVAALAPAAIRIIRRMAPGVPVENVRTISQIREESVSPRRLNAALISSFGLLALLIAAVGIAGVLAFSVSARTAEIGIRMGLGADAARVQRMILREGGVLLAIGLAIGTAAAILAARVIRGLLYGVAPHDPATFAAVAFVMLAIGTAACWIPALRASRIDPAITMRA